MKNYQFDLTSLNGVSDQLQMVYVGQEKMEEGNKNEISGLVQISGNNFMKEGGGYISDFDFSGFEIRRRSSLVFNE